VWFPAIAEELCPVVATAAFPVAAGESCRAIVAAALAMLATRAVAAAWVAVVRGKLWKPKRGLLKLRRKFS
jgi:hypothetical protein